MRNFLARTIGKIGPNLKAPKSIIEDRLLERESERDRGIEIDRDRKRQKNKTEIEEKKES